MRQLSERERGLRSLVPGTVIFARIPVEHKLADGSTVTSYDLSPATYLQFLDAIFGSFVLVRVLNKEYLLGTDIVAPTCCELDCNCMHQIEQRKAHAA